MPARRARAATRSPPSRPVLTAELLERRYQFERASAEQIAADTGWSGQYVRDRLRQFGIALRPRGASKPAPLDPAALAEWLEQGRPVTEIAAASGYSPSGVYQQIRRLQLPAPGARSAPPPAPAQLDELAEITRLYVDEQHSLRTIGTACGRGPDWVRARLQAAGVTVRRPGNRSSARPSPAPELDADELTRLYNSGLALPQIAARTGSSPAAVSAALHAAGVQPRRGRRRTSPDLEQLRELYVEQRLTLTQVAARAGCSVNQVRAGLLAASVQLRPSRQPARADILPPITVEQLRELYQVQQLTLDEIAKQLGGSPTRVTGALGRHQIPRRDPHARRSLPDVDLDRDALRRLYVEERLDDSAIAARHGVPTWRITRRRRQLGVTRPPVPPPHPTPPTAAPSPDELRALYLDQALPVAQIARRYRTGTPTARAWLHDAGIPVRPRTARTHRTALDSDELRQLYTDRQWSSTEIAAHLGTTQHLVLRALHDGGIPVRRGGSPRTRTPRPEPAAAQLLADLYADRQVTQVLRRHRVPRRSQPGPIAHRFPTAVPLTTALLAALYDDVGLSARQIELLTGQPHEQVLDALRAAGLQVRLHAGRSPWSARRY